MILTHNFDRFRMYKKILNSQLRRMKKFGPTFHFYNVKLLGRLESSAGQVNPIPPPPFPPFPPARPPPLPFSWVWLCGMGWGWLKRIYLNCYQLILYKADQVISMLRISDWHPPPRTRPKNMLWPGKVYSPWGNKRNNLCCCKISQKGGGAIAWFECYI